jgi:hypothetical protein
VEGFCEHDDEPLGLINCWELLSREVLDFIELVGWLVS